MRYEDLERMHAARDVDGLLAVMNGANNKLRHSAAEMLGDCGDQRCIAPLESMVREGQFSHLRGAAARALGQLRATKAVPALIEALSDDVYYARAGAARALGQIGDVRAVEPLIALLRDDREYVRWVAADALRKLGEGAVGPLVRQLDSDKGRGVEMFALVLGHIGDERGVPVLRELAETHPENYVKQTARRALDMIEGRELESSRQPD